MSPETESAVARIVCAAISEPSMGWHLSPEDEALAKNWLKERKDMSVPKPKSEGIPGGEDIVPSPTDAKIAWEQRAAESAAQAAARPEQDYLLEFAELNNRGENEGEVWVCSVPCGRDFSHDTPERVAARKYIESRGWTLDRTEPTGIRDNSRWDVWKEAS